MANPSGQPAQSSRPADSPRVRKRDLTVGGGPEHAGDHPVAVLAGVVKRYSPWGPWVLSGIDLAISGGTTTLITGSNGSGKSTLLRILAAASAPTGGSVLLPARGKTAYVPERLASHLRMTATAYVGHMGRLRGLPDSQVRQRANELFDRLGVSPGPGASIASLSKGNSQKVALAQALLAPVDLLVLDEAFSGLDDRSTAELTVLLTRAREEGAAVVVSAHGRDAVPNIDRVLTLRQGALTG